MKRNEYQIFTEKEKREIFAKASCCSSSLMRWMLGSGGMEEKKKILSRKNLAEKVNEILNSLDNFIVRKIGGGAWNNRENRGKLTNGDYEELLTRSQEIEAFIKNLEIGTQFVGEFDRDLTEALKQEEEDFELWQEYWQEYKD